MPRFDRRSGLCLLLLAAVLAAYAPALLHGDFTWDDYKFVEANPRLIGPEGLRALWLHPGTLSSHGAAVPEVEVHWFPVLYTTFWIERWLWGSFWAPGFHGTNLLIHFCNALLAWGLLARLRVPGPFLVALIWAVHPGPWRPSASSWAARTSSPHPSSCWRPGYGSGRFRPFPVQSMSAPRPANPATNTTALGTASDVAGGRRDGPAGYGGDALQDDGGGAARASPAPPPPARGSPVPGARRASCPAAGGPGRCGALPVVRLRPALRSAVHDFSFTERILLAAGPPGRTSPDPRARTLPLRFHSWTVSPTDLAGWAALAAWGIVLPVALRLRPYGRSALLIGLLWFLVCLSPTLGLVDHPSLHMSLAWSRYRYLASLGPWALAVGAGLAALHHVSRQPRRLPRALGRGALRGLGLAALLTAGLTTARFSILFSNDATWFQHLARHAPASDWLASHFVNALIRAGHTGRALRVAEARFLSDPSACATAATGPSPAWPRAGTPRPRRTSGCSSRFLTGIRIWSPGPRASPPRTVAGPWPLERDDLRLIWFNYGILLAELGRPLEARAMFFRAQQVRPAPGDVWIFRTGPRRTAGGRHRPACCPRRTGVCIVGSPLSGLPRPPDSWLPSSRGPGSRRRHRAFAGEYGSFRRRRHGGSTPSAAVVQERSVCVSSGLRPPSRAGLRVSPEAARSSTAAHHLAECHVDAAPGFSPAPTNSASTLRTLAMPDSRLARIASMVRTSAPRPAARFATTAQCA